MSHDPCQVVYDALDAHGCQPHGPVYSFVALCPTHEDRSPSLSGGIGVDGRAVLWCHTGNCDTGEIVRVIGLQWSDLFPDGIRRAPRARQPRLVTEPALDSAKRVLNAAGIEWHPTAEPDMIVVGACPACRQPELWLHDDGYRLRASCWRHGCSSCDILTTLRQIVTGGRDAA